MDNNPKIFGRLSTLTHYSSGYNLLCLYNVSHAHLPYLMKLINWKDRNHLGFNALETCAYECQALKVRAILMSLNDEEFVEYCTPFIFGS